MVRARRRCHLPAAANCQLPAARCAQARPSVGHVKLGAGRAAAAQPSPAQPSPAQPSPAQPSLASHPAAAPPGALPQLPSPPPAPTTRRVRNGAPDAAESRRCLESARAHNFTTHAVLTLSSSPVLGEVCLCVCVWGGGRLQCSHLRLCLCPLADAGA
jgi:hypothetical protein